MKKGTKQMALLLAAAVCLGGVYAGLNIFNRVQEKKEQEAEEAQKVYISQIEDISSLSVTNTNGQFAFTYDSEEEIWKSGIADEFPLKTSQVTGITGKLESLQAVRELTDADSDLAVYGLDEPVYQVTVKGEDEELTIYVGDQSSASSDYYLKTDTSDTIYTVASSFVTALNFSEDDLVNTETFPTISSGNITAITWQSGDYELTWHKENRIVEEESETETVSEELTESETLTEEEESLEAEIETETETETEEQTTAEPVTEEYWMADDTEQTETDDFDAALSLLGSLSFEGFADWYLEEDELPDYGLNDSAGPVKVTITYLSAGEETTVVLKIGSSMEDGMYYCTLNDGTMVNLLDAEDVITLTNGFSFLAKGETEAEEVTETEVETETETLDIDLSEEETEEETVEG